MPPEGGLIQVSCHHAACDTTTQVRIPRPLPPSVVRRVTCDGCGESYSRNPAAPHEIRIIPAQRAPRPTQSVATLPSPAIRKLSAPDRPAGTAKPPVEDTGSQVIVRPVQNFGELSALVAELESLDKSLSERRASATQAAPSRPTAPGPAAPTALAADHVPAPAVRPAVAESAAAPAARQPVSTHEGETARTDAESPAAMAGAPAQPAAEHPPRASASEPALDGGADAPSRPVAVLKTALGVLRTRTGSRPGAGVATALLAAAAVTGWILLIQGTGDDRSNAAPPTPEPSAAAPFDAGGDVPQAAGGSASGEGVQFVKRDTWSLALPAGWTPVKPRGDIAYRAETEDGLATVTLWVERDAKLSFRAFERRAVRNLKTLSPKARVFNRDEGPTDRDTIVQLKADVPTGRGGSAPYVVTLRNAGPYFYYLATSVKPEASKKARDAAAVIHGSLNPEVSG